MLPVGGGNCIQRQMRCGYFWHFWMVQDYQDWGAFVVVIIVFNFAKTPTSVRAYCYLDPIIECHFTDVSFAVGGGYIGKVVIPKCKMSNLSHTI